MRIAGLAMMAVGVALTMPGQARADGLVAIRPGVMCTSPEALGRLTLPGGESRTHLPSPTAGDLGLAASGGCIDIPLGARVTVQRAFKNTSVVTYAGEGAPPGSTMIVPNVDFRPAAEAAATQAPAPAGPGGPAFALPGGYSVAQRVPAGGPDGDVLVILQDRRITPAMRELAKGNGGDPYMMFDQGSPLAAEFTRRPFLNAQLLLVSASGATVARKQLERPLATVEPAPLHGLPAPTFLFTVDYSIGMGGYNGPAAQLLVPSERRLDPVEAVTDRGGSAGPIYLGRTMHAGWQIVPSRGGTTEEIEVVYCQVGNNDQRLQMYQTYRFRDGRWTVTSRLHGECSEIEAFPARREFP